MVLFPNALIKLALFVAPVFAVPSTLKTVSKYNGQVKADSYIVTLKPGVSKADHLASLGLSPNSNITHQWDTVLNGFAGTFSANDLNLLRASSDVEAIEEDGIVTTFVTTTQTNAPWGLGRISTTTKLADQNAADLTFTYTYDSSAGTGVDIYVIDTGIYIAHPAFQGRASWGATFGGYASADGNGHGTHVAGTAISGPYGVAKAAHAIAVKVLSDAGSGSYSDVISGMDWVATTAAGTGRPSIASMSLGGGASTAVDNAVTTMTNAGVIVVVAAGNGPADASTVSPARAANAIAIGASDITDSYAYFSNYGTPVAVFAPGQAVISTWNNGGTNSISGTSMATPHVSGLVAYMMALDSSLTPANIKSTLQARALSGVLAGVPAGTVNLLVNNGF